MGWHFQQIARNICAAKYAYANKSYRDFERDHRDSKCMTEKGSIRKGCPGLRRNKNLFCDIHVMGQCTLVVLPIANRLESTDYQVKKCFDFNTVVVY